MCNKTAVLNVATVVEERSEEIQKKLREVKRLLSKDIVKKIALSQKNTKHK